MNTMPSFRAESGAPYDRSLRYNSAIQRRSTENDLKTAFKSNHCWGRAETSRPST